MPSPGPAARITITPAPIWPIPAPPHSFASISTEVFMIKAIRFEKHGGPEVLEYRDYDLPAPPRGAVQVRNAVIGVNFIDIYHRSGLYPMPLPSGLGLEAAGVVEALGDGATGFAPGERVGYCSGVTGAYAQAANVPADKLVKLPDSISDEIAAAALLKGM